MPRISYISNFPFRPPAPGFRPPALEFQCCYTSKLVLLTEYLTREWLNRKMHLQLGRLHSPLPTVLPHTPTSIPSVTARISYISNTPSACPRISMLESTLVASCVSLRNPRIDHQHWTWGMFLFRLGCCMTKGKTVTTLKLGGGRAWRLGSSRDKRNFKYSVGVAGQRALQFWENRGVVGRW